MHPLRIHILGPAGSGTTTLAINLSKELRLLHLDTDAYFWKQTPLPFTEKNPVAVRLRNIEAAIQGKPDWVLSGSLCSWGDPLIKHFTHVIYLWVPWDIRQERLRRRERERYGAAALAPGGAMHEVNRDFMDWASRYDTAGMEQRSRVTHEHWMQRLPRPIPVIRIERDLPPAAITQLALAGVRAEDRRGGSGKT